MVNQQCFNVVLLRLVGKLLEMPTVQFWFKRDTNESPELILSNLL